MYIVNHCLLYTSDIPQEIRGLPSIIFKLIVFFLVISYISLTLLNDLILQDKIPYIFIIKLESGNIYFILFF